MRVRSLLVAFFCLLSPILVFGDSVRITSVTPDIELYPGDQVGSFRVVAVRENPTPPGSGGSARVLIRELTADSGLLLREVELGTANENSTTRTITFGGGNFTIRPLICLQVQPTAGCPAAARELSASLQKVRLEIVMILTVQTPSGPLRLESPPFPVPVTYPEIASISRNSQPLFRVQPVQVTTRNTDWTQVNNLQFLLYKTDDSSIVFTAGDSDFATGAPIPIFRNVTANSFEVRVNTEDRVAAFNSEQASLRKPGAYDIVLRWSPPFAPSGTFVSRREQFAFLPRGYRIEPALQDDSVTITKMEVIIEDEFRTAAKRKTATWAPGSTLQLDAEPNGWLTIEFEGTYKLSRWYYALLWTVLRPAGATGPLEASNNWAYMKKTAGNFEPLEDRGRLPPTKIRRTLRLPATPGPLELFLIFTAQDHETGTGAKPILTLTGTFGKSATTLLDWGAPLDVSVDHIEVVQVTQDKDNTILPLVAGKATAARVFLKVAGDDVRPYPGVSAVLHGFRNNREIPGNPENAYNQPITAPTAFRRERHDDSLNFILPDAWITEGDLELRVELKTASTDKDPANNNWTAPKIFPFRKMTQASGSDLFTVAYLPFCYWPPSEPRAICPDDAVLAQAESVLTKLLPVAPNQIVYLPYDGRVRIWDKPVHCELNFFGKTICPKVDEFMDYVNQIFEQSGKSYDQMVGWLPSLPTPAAPNAAPPLGRANSISGGGNGHILFAQENSRRTITAKRIENGVQVDKVSVVKDNRQPARNLIHEISHNLGRRHLSKVKEGEPGYMTGSCGGWDPATTWPYQNGEIQEVGFDPSDKSVKAPTVTDLMSYCEPPYWMSPDTYTKIMQGRLDAATESVPGRRLRAAGVSKWTIISGSARADGSSGRLNPLVQVEHDAAPSQPSPKPTHCLKFSGASGALGQHCFQLTFVDSETQEALDQRSFTVRIALPEGTSRIALTAGEQELTAVTASASAPVVAITSPKSGDVWDGGKRTITWTGSDADGDTLVYAVHSSSDNGQTWQALDFSLTATQYEVDPAQIAGGSGVFFRIIASDGVNSASADVGPLNLVQVAKLEGPAALAFHNQVVAQTAERPLVLRNSGSGPLTVDSLVVDSREFSFGDVRTPIMVPAGAIREIPVRWNVARTGPLAAKITVAATGLPAIEIAVTGNGIPTATAEIEVTPARVDFGTVAVAGQSREMTVSVRNWGPADLLVERFGVSNNQFTVVSPTGSFSLGPDEEQAVQLRFTPTAGGSQSANLTIASNDPTRASVTVPLTGSGPAAPQTRPVISVTPARLDFGTVAPGQTKDLTLTVANTGDAALAISSISISADRFNIQSPAVPFTVAPGGQQAVVVRYAPNAPASVNAALTVNSNDVVRPSTSIPLAAIAEGTPPVTQPEPRIAVSVASLDFGSVTAGQTKDLTFTVQNTGDATLIVSSFAMTNARFAIQSGAAPLNVAAKASQSLTVRFSPLAAGRQSGTLTIVTNDSVRPRAAVEVAGDGAAPGGPRTVVLQLDDGTFERGAGFIDGGFESYFLNRITPPSYPAILKSIQIYFRDESELPPNHGISVLYGVNPNGLPELGSVQVRSVAGRVTAFNRFLEFAVPETTIEAGDFLVGFNTSNPAGALPGAVDSTSVVQQRSYLGRDGQLFNLVGIGNLGIRAVVELR